ncbi:thioesterase superfamily protein [Sporodiniella umbellata]|nr:thioesterase superfamily protein [Sporodiniella umbellata]
MGAQDRLSAIARQVSTDIAKKATFRERHHYKYFLPIQTRWNDNDQYGHVNNSVYYHYIDTVTCHFLNRYCGVDGVDKSKPIPFVAASSADYYAPASYPSVIYSGLSILKVGNSSVTYRVGLFENEEPLASVVGGYTHVFVNPVSKRPVKISTEMQATLERYSST